MTRTVGDVKIIDSWWTRNQLGHNMGFVLTENGVGIRKVFLGTATGNDVEFDEKAIVRHGGKVHANLITRLLSGLNEGKGFE